uniref:Hydantoinase/oxoprolinase N-terminal domain-containing protein n=1 Tax=Thermodesulfobacterium geofontis TaxID=1295609 RepID=A0A7C4NQN3_9BACT
MRVAIDTGGTFTDLIYLEGGFLKSKKVFSTPKDPSQAILEALNQINKGYFNKTYLFNKRGKV